MWKCKIIGHKYRASGGDGASCFVYCTRCDYVSTEQTKELRRIVTELEETDQE